MDIDFLKFTNDHKEYIWLTYVEAMKPHIEKIWGWNDAWQEDNFLTSLDTYSTYTLVSDQQKIGYIQFRHDPDLTFLSMIVLEKEYRSKGYGPIIINKIQALQPKLPLKLRCFKVNEAAYTFYLSNGFDIVSSDNEFHTLCRKEILQKFKNDVGEEIGEDIV